jgi:hypothetical protein
VSSFLLTALALIRHAEFSAATKRNSSKIIRFVAGFPKDIAGARVFSEVDKILKNCGRGN